MTVITTPLVGWGAYYLGGPEPAVAATIGCLSGLLLTPDLDLSETGTRSHLYARRLGVGWLWFIWWWGYGKLTTHRGVSHTPLLGTLTRLLWGMPFTPAWLWYFGAIAWTTYLWWAGGLALSDLLHWIADRFTSKIKRFNVSDEECC